MNFEANRDLYEDHEEHEHPDMFMDDVSSTTSRIKEIITLPMSKSVKAVFDIDDIDILGEEALDGGQGQEFDQIDQVDPSAVVLGI